MKIEQMRQAIANVYSGPTWRTKCLYEMSDNQVVAIYKDMERTGRLTKKINKKRPKLPNYTEPECIQLSIWDFLKE